MGGLALGGGDPDQPGECWAPGWAPELSAQCAGSAQPEAARPGPDQSP